MTQRLYYEDSYQQDFDATVVSCERDEKSGLYGVVLDRTAFFPEGGGQYADPGVLDGVKVEDVQEKGDEIIHYIKEELPAGKTVAGHIDFDERFSRMQQHSGEHIVSGLVHGRFGYDNVGFHLGESVTTMDFNGPVTWQELMEIEKEANTAVVKDLPIEISYPTREELTTLTYRSKKEIEGQVRIVTIPGYDVCACCAPHVATTGQIGIIKITDCVKYKGGTRVSMLAGFRALTDYNLNEEEVKDISHLLSAKPDEICEAVTHLHTETLELRSKIISLQSQILEERLSEITAQTQDYILFEEETDKNAARRFVDTGMRRAGGICGIFIGDDENGYQYILGSVTENLRDLLGAFHEACPGKGGGKPEMVQGSAKCTRADIERFFDARSSS